MRLSSIATVERNGRIIFCYSPWHDVLLSSGSCRGQVTALLSSPWCVCRAPDDPDDMALGSCLGRLGYSPLHLHQLHQVVQPHAPGGAGAPHEPCSAASCRR